MKDLYRQDVTNHDLRSGINVGITAGASTPNNFIQEGNTMAKYVCDACGWEYDEELGSPENGIAPGTKFADLPDDFECPLCGVGKDMFSEA